jgi:hypothetical protein
MEIWWQEKEKAQRACIILSDLIMEHGETLKSFKVETQVIHPSFSPCETAILKELLR